MLDRARSAGILPEKAWAILDTTGLETEHASRYYRYRRRRDDRPISIRHWPKLGLSVEPRSHLILGAVIGHGLSYDFAYFEPLLRQSLRQTRVTLAMSDGGFDSEQNHAIAREGLGIPRTLINLNRRGNGPTIHGRYRREMARRFDRHVYGQRWQAESAISMHKRRFDPALRSRFERTQNQEALLRILAHDIAIVR